MERWRGQEEIPSDWGRCVLTIGVFDGVHRGHAELIARAVKAGRSRGVPTVLMTFDPHPMEVVFPGSHPAQLTTLARRAELVEELGIDVFLVMPFTTDFMKLTHERYIHELLVERLHVIEVVVPSDVWEGDAEASVSVWFFEDGETVQNGALLGELMFEKTAVEVRAPGDGILRIKAPPEAVVHKGDVLALIE